MTFQSLPFYFSAQVKNINIFAFSYFFDRATELGLIGNALKFMPLSSSGIFGVQLWLLLSPLHQIKQITYYTALLTPLYARSKFINLICMIHHIQLLIHPFIHLCILFLVYPFN